MNGKIFVVCTDAGQYDQEDVLQLLTKSNLLAFQSNGSVTAVCMGEFREDQFNTLMEYGADSVLFHQCHVPLSSNRMRDIAIAMIEEKKPEVVLFPATDEGKRLAAVLSSHFDAGLTADCIDIGIEADGDFYFTRTAMNDSVIAKIRCINCDLKMGTVKQGVFVREKGVGKQGGAIEKFFMEPKPYTEEIIQVLERVFRKKKSQIDIGKASVVFCIGRGVKQSGTYERICKLADLCNAEITATRAAVEDLFIDKERQVGQSGKSISPRLYISFGVSGASQHMVGIKNAGILVAVNHDPHALVFSYADYAIVDEIEAVVRELEKFLSMEA